MRTPSSPRGGQRARSHSISSALPRAPWITAAKVGVHIVRRAARLCLDVGGAFQRLAVAVLDHMQIHRVNHALPFPCDCTGNPGRRNCCSTRALGQHCYFSRRVVWQFSITNQRPGHHARTRNSREKSRPSRKTAENRNSPFARPFIPASEKSDSRRPAAIPQVGRIIIPWGKRIEQKGRVCHFWWTPGERPPGLCDRRFTFSTIFAAVGPGTDYAFALVMPYADTAAMQIFLNSFAETIADDQHAVMILKSLCSFPWIPAANA